MKTTKGFTLIELAVVIAIIAILAAVVVAVVLGGFVAVLFVVLLRTPQHERAHDGEPCPETLQETEHGEDLDRLGARARSRRDEGPPRGAGLLASCDPNGGRSVIMLFGGGAGLAPGTSQRLAGPSPGDVWAE